MSSSVDSRAAARTAARRNAVIVRDEVVRPTYAAPSKQPPSACSGVRAFGTPGGPGAEGLATYSGNTCFARSAAHRRIASGIPMSP